MDFCVEELIHNKSFGLEAPVLSHHVAQSEVAKVFKYPKVTRSSPDKSLINA